MSGPLRPLLLRLGRLSGLDVFVQSRCAICAGLKLLPDRPVTRPEDLWTDLLCQNCLGLILTERPVYPGTCQSCARPATEHEPVCPACLSNAEPWLSLAFFCYYHGPVRNLIKEFKFSGRLAQVRLMRAWALAAFVSASQRQPDLPLPDMIVPVPLHRSRASGRGYNQSLEMARLLSRREHLPLRPGALKRIRLTPPQAGLRRQDRLVNLTNAFAAEPAVVSGRHILLADDVTTTRATLREAARTLRLAGAASVQALVLAVTPDRG